MFDYPTVDAISAFLAAELCSSTTVAAANGGANGDALIDSYSTTFSSSALVQIAVHPLHPNKFSQVAIVGMHARAPATSTTADAIRLVPLDRWDADHGLSIKGPKMFSAGRFGGFVAEWASFDPGAFGISVPEAQLMDPQQRCLLEDAAQFVGVEDVGNETAVAVGIAKLGEPLYYPSTVGGAGAGGGYVATGKAASAAAGRISYTFGLCGPCIAVDTACSSSLVGLGYVQSAMLSGNPTKTNRGLAAGVNLPMNWETSSMFAAASMMAIDGRCKTLDAAANGYVRSEACVVVALAINPSSPPLALLASVGCNQDGRSSTLTAPNGPSQQSVMISTANAAGLALSKIGGIEMHGTGTALGDPIEVGAISAVLKHAQTHFNHVRLGTTKSRSGHAETAAGLLGLFSAVNQLSTALQKETLHLTSLNPYVEAVFATPSDSFAPARVSAPCSNTHDNTVVGVSAFAFAGTNAHALLVQQQQHHPSGLDTTKNEALMFNKKQRMWFIPPPHPSVVCCALVTSTAAEFEVDFHRPSQSYLWEHCVGGRSILPGAAMFDTAHAAVEMLLNNNNNHGASTAVVYLNDASIPMPCILPSTLMTSTSSRMRCSVSFTARVELFGSQKSAVHLTSTARSFPITTTR